MTRRILSLLGLGLTLFMGLPSAVSAQGGGTWYYIWTAVAPPTLPGSWVPVEIFLSPSGCTGCDCGGSWRPGSAEGLGENPPDRWTLGHNQPGIKTPTWDPRDSCPAGTDLAGDLTAGTWYHNAHFDLDCSSGHADCVYDYAQMVVRCTRYCSWSGMRDQGWVFIENDNCCPSGNCGEPPADSCPPDSWAYSSISARNWQWQPEHPVVLGQDPSDLGVNILFDLSLPPAIHTWYEEQVKCTTPPPLPGATPEPPVCTTTCVEHQELVRDTISGIHASIALQDESIDWIENELAGRYPNAKVINPAPAADLSPACYYSGKTHHCHVTVHFDTADPGYYDFTAGATATLNGARSFGFDPGRPVLVYLKDSTLVPDN